jgi:hypothetical protein
MQIDLEPHEFRKLRKIPEPGESIWGRGASNRTYNLYIAIAGFIILAQIWGAGEIFSWRLWSIVGPSMLLAWALLLRFPAYFLTKLD